MLRRPYAPCHLIATRLAGALALAACTFSLEAQAQSLSTRMQAVGQRQAADQARREATSKSAILGRLLYMSMPVKVTDQPVKSVLESIASTLEIKVRVRYADERNQDGIDPELPITVDAEGVSALAVIEQILEQCSIDRPCTWQLREGYLELGPKELLAAPGARLTRIYPVADLLYEPPRFNNAPDFNLNGSLQQGQGAMGGGGGGTGGGGGGFGGAGGGGGFGGGGGGFGGGGGSGGGSVFGDPGEDPERKSKEELADELIEVIKSTCEPDAWTNDWADIRYFQGSLIVTAPDFVQRTIAGYPFAPRVPAPPPPKERRYVGLTVPIGISSNLRFVPVPVSGAVGGTGGAAP